MSDDLHSILRNAQSVVIVGCSADPFRASHRAALWLADAGYDVIPVNPKYDQVNGIACRHDFSDVPDDLEIDIVNVFRNSAHAAETVEAVRTRAERTGERPVIWTQPGVSSSDARDAARKAGFRYVENRCIMTELAGMRSERNQDGTEAS